VTVFFLGATVSNTKANSKCPRN